MENSRNRWMDYSTVNKEYLDGVENFQNHAFRENNDGGTISCPFTKCVLYYQVNRAVTYDHLIVNGIPSYNTWFSHGESLNGSTSTGENNDRQKALRRADMREMIHDIFGSFIQFNDNISEKEETTA
ncbi:hypothetical protein RDI58_007622 [Solanum bulbocastanum]|uniref:Transposase-associated domain-containing protein n=1 Tax=Solanum bulbocastanum TaxID=147425 RepID=A0AAN8YHV6_SOLBU